MRAVRAAAARIAFALSRRRAGGAVVGWTFAHASGWLPVSRLYETDAVVAFHHPKPSYAVHVLIVPKRAIAGINALGPADRSVPLDVVMAAQQVVRGLRLDRSGYRLVVNGGAFQDVGQLHFHLISDDGETSGRAG